MTIRKDNWTIEERRRLCLPGRFIEVNLDALHDAQYLPRVAVDEGEGVALIGDEQAAGSPLIQGLSQCPPDLRLPGGVAEEGAEVEDVGTHGAEQLIAALLDPGTPAADLVRVVAIADVARIGFSDEQGEDRMEEIARRLGQGIAVFERSLARPEKLLHHPSARDVDVYPSEEPGTEEG